MRPANLRNIEFIFTDNGRMDFIFTDDRPRSSLHLSDIIYTSKIKSTQKFYTKPSFVKRVARSAASDGCFRLPERHRHKFAACRGRHALRGKRAGICSSGGGFSDIVRKFTPTSNFSRTTEGGRPYYIFVEFMLFNNSEIKVS